MPRPSIGPRNHTSPFIWCAAIICAVLAIVVIIVGMVAFISYLTIRPRVPTIRVASAQLDTIYFDQSNVLTLQVTIVIHAENDNEKAFASFYNTTFGLSFQGQRLAVLVAEKFGVSSNSTIPLNYVVQSSGMPLSPRESEALNLALRRRVLNLELMGTTRTRWRVGIIGSVKFWLHLRCPLSLPVDGTRVYPTRRNCNSRSR